MQKELISEHGFQKFVTEFNHLLKKEKPKWVKEKEITAAFGDRSENAEYISAKEMIRNIDKRLRFLEGIIQRSEVVNIDSLPHDRVNFGSLVTILDLDTKEEKSYTILGTYEIEPKESIISVKSPMGKALFGKKTGDEFELNINGTIYEYRVLKIEKS